MYALFFMVYLTYLSWFILTMLWNDYLVNIWLWFDLVEQNGHTITN